MFLVDVVSAVKSKLLLENETTQLVNQTEEVVLSETQFKLEADFDSTGIS